MTGLEPLFGALLAGAISAGASVGISALAGGGEPPKAPDPLDNSIDQQAKKFAEARLKSQVSKFGSEDTILSGASRQSTVKPNLGAT